MIRLFREVANEEGITEKEVEEIYRLYLNAVKEATKKNPEREIYLEKFGKITPSIWKIKQRLKEAFKHRRVEVVKKHISTLRKLNYKPKKI